MSIQGFSVPSVKRALWAADKRHAPHSVRALLTQMGIAFTPCLGSYDDTWELSYMTALHDFDRIAPMLCKGQESVLILGARDSRNRAKATLHFANTDWNYEGEDETWRDDVDLGVFYSLPVSEARKRDAFTIILDQTDVWGEVLAFACAPVDRHGEPVPFGFEYKLEQRPRTRPAI